MAGALTTSQLLAAASETLTSGGYEAVPTPTDWSHSNCRFFEDPYGIVAVFTYETWSSLAGTWHEAQGSLVELISTYLAKPEPKSWEGYLVLLTPSAVPLDSRSELAEIRYDTGRVRKLVATGEDLETLEQVEQALLPLLPLVVEAQVEAGEALLGRLPSLLEPQGIDPSATRLVVEAFGRNESILEQLHAGRGNE